MTVFRRLENIREDVNAAIANGGGTIPVVVSQKIPDHGYVVAIKRHELILDSVDIVPALVSLRNWVTDKAHVPFLPNEFLGVWVADNRTVFLDVVRVIGDRDEAIAYGKSQDQLAIFSLHENQEIRI